MLTTFLQAYDYAGSWLTYADNQANLYGGARTGVSGDAAVAWYLSHGATASKINLGVHISLAAQKYVLTLCQACPSTDALSKAPTVLAKHTAVSV